MTGNAGVNIVIRMDYDRTIKKLSNEQANLVLENINLVYHLAHRYKGKGLPFDDLVAEGKRGLISGACSYDPSRPGASAMRSTLLGKSIKGYMINALKKERRQGFTIGRAADRDSFEEDDSANLKKSNFDAKAKTLECRIGHRVSLNAPLIGKRGEESETTLCETITMDDIDERHEEVTRTVKGMRELVFGHITNPSELKVLRLSFCGYSTPQIAKMWYNDDDSKTSEERERGVSHQAIQTYYNRAVERLRDLPASKFDFRN